MSCETWRRTVLLSSAGQDFTGNIIQIYIVRNCTGDKIEKNEMDWACGVYG